MKGLIETMYESGEAKDLKKLVGSIVVHFVQCELLGSMLVDWSTLTRSGSLVFENHWNTEKRILEYKKIMNRKKSEMRIEKFRLINAWLDELEKLKHLRNQVVHSAWIPFTGLNEYDRNLVRSISNGKKKLHRERITKKELEKIDQDVICLHSEGWEIFHKIFPFKVSTNKTVKKGKSDG
jgi:hypothetical protein